MTLRRLDPPRRWRLVIIAACLSALVLGVAPNSFAGRLHDTPASPKVDPWQCGAGWSSVTEPPVLEYIRQQGIAALSPSDAWAVGTRAGDTYTDHCDGTSWQAVQVPTAPTRICTRGN